MQETSITATFAVSCIAAKARLQKFWYIFGKMLLFPRMFHQNP